MELIKRYGIRYITSGSNIQWPNFISNHHQSRRSDYWITKDNHVIRIDQMTNRHLLSVLRMLHNLERPESDVHNFMKKRKILDKYLFLGDQLFELAPKEEIRSYQDSRKQYEIYWKTFYRYMRLRQEALARDLLIF